MDEGPIDIRTIPIPEWSARTLSALPNGKWTYFYDKRNNAPVFNYEPYSSGTMQLITHRYPEGLTTGRSFCATKRSEIQDDISNRNYPPRKDVYRRQIFHQNHVDKYTLYKDSKRRERNQQKIYLNPSKSLQSPNDTIRSRSMLSQTFVPSETNVIEELKPVFPESPSLGITKINKKGKNDESKLGLSNEDRLYQTNYERDVFFFYDPSKRKTAPEEQIKHLIEDYKTKKLENITMSRQLHSGTLNLSRKRESALETQTLPNSPSGS
ncbi:hypothetical protein TRFO_16040 [Tritrichomonas foetus]|uniref:Uncharacterized protein n=1 Tax=Tritrichomonas foetus TaxID=1144522 RepID=A0A1J4KS59_9EUKA|nr:hypothetical protein TRFO_16040 [Tritrichomonas foetus]|eukprot:OHT13720.1 hypothetical protein TRFO_16040 [Tritrichomonas foetus]